MHADHVTGALTPGFIEKCSEFCMMYEHVEQVFNMEQVDVGALLWSFILTLMSHVHLSGEFFTVGVHPFTIPDNPSKFLHCLPHLYRIQCNILLSMALVPYLYLNTSTSCYRSRKEGRICRSTCPWLLKNIKLQAPKQVLTILSKQPFRSMVTMWRFYALSFWKLQGNIRCQRA
ncbi:hypothetical protein EDC04DRAFT_766948 [Pisolithus marmoratus]|nr:hypothetical protein EDC04DRAFT_766948 [Pisolithus marmoratus]